MKNPTKLIALLLACIMVLNIGVMAADNPAETETTAAVTEVTTQLDESTTDTTEESTTVADESTTGTTEESTTAADESTTGTTEESTTVADESTTGTTEESTTAADESTTGTTEESTTAVDESTTGTTEESTTVADESTTGTTEESTTVADESTTGTTEESTTVADESTTGTTEESTTAVDESTTAPDVTTTTPEVTNPTDPTEPSEPEVTEPTDPTEPTEPEATDPTEPEKPEVTLPEAPAKVEAGDCSYGRVRIDWDKVEGADGYNIYTKNGDEWILVDSDDVTNYTFEDLIYNSKYEVGVRAYITVDGEKYLSEDIATTIIVTPAEVPSIMFPGGSAPKNSIDITWSLDGGVSGYIVYLRKDSKWVRLAKLDSETDRYRFENALPGKTYKFGVKAFAKGTEGTAYSKLLTIKVTCDDYSKTEVKASSVTSSSITVKWGKIDGAASYRVYILKGGKWKYYKGITKTSYKITDLDASTKYQIKVKPCFKQDGEVIWGTYSDTISVTTKGKTVKSYRVGQLKKYFTDGDWSIKVTGLDDGAYGKLDYTMAVKGTKVFVRYDYKDNSDVRDFEYLIDINKKTVNLIFDDNKTYTTLTGEDADTVFNNTIMMALIFDMSTAKGVTAKTTVYSGKTAVAEIYNDKDLDIKKTFYFVNDKVKALKVTYFDGTYETFKIAKINDTPSSSVFSIPKGYKVIK